MNTKSENYWTLLAQSTGLDYNSLISTVRNNPHSQFVAQEIAAAQLDRSKMEAIAKAVGENITI
ncbi:penicillin-binding protein 3 [Actinobacillus equuli]|nr:penicillin-binding protein 3 [Actinobacillus equuli]